MFRKVASYVLAFLVLPAVLLLALEGGARLFAPDDMTLRHASEDLLDQRDGRFPYVLRAGYHGPVWQRDVTINSLHLRSPEPDPNGDTAKAVRLLLIGDSVIFGMGLADEDAPTALLEASLGEPYRVLNAGVPGYSTEHAAAFLEEFGDQVHPDAVVLGYCLNDPVPGDQEVVVRVQRVQQRVDWATQINLWLRAHSMLYLRLKDAMDVYRLRHDYMGAYRPLYNETSWQRSRAALLRIVDWSRARGIPFFMVIFPHRDQLVEEIPTDDHPQRLLAGLSEEAGFRLLDLRPVLAPEDYQPNDVLHLDKRGMRKAMEATAGFLRADLPTPPGAHQAVKTSQ